MIKRIFFWITLNLIVISSFTIMGFLISNVFGYNGTLPLALYATILGFAGSLLSLFSSKFMAKYIYDLQDLHKFKDKNKSRIAIVTIEELARKHNIKIPDIYFYDGKDLNAFATGPSKNNSLIAFSSKLLDEMDSDSIQGIAAHEVGHIVSGDMVTMTLLQGIINSVVLYVGHFISRNFDNLWIGLLVNIILQIFGGLIGGIFLAWFSRKREYKADNFAKINNGAGNIRTALQKLLINRDKNELEMKNELKRDPTKEAYQYFGIAGISLSNLYATHPPLEKRIAVLS